MVWLIWAIPLVIIVFLWSVNEHLKGRLTYITGIVLFWLMAALWVVAFFVSGWKFALGAFISSFIMGAAFHFPATLVANAILNNSGGNYKP